MAGDAPGTAHENPARPGGVPDPAPLALYRKYRPATFAEVKGQEHVTEPLRQALRSGRINHAYLFSGPRGCGKTSSARILARSLNCEQGPTPDPCGVCASCVALAPSGPGSIDVIEIDAASHGGVDDARDLRERAFYAPVSARFKIYIIDEAHMVTGGGFNALLKLVEEPPPHLKFVFATTEPEKVIPTIRSRTHHYPFRLVPPAVLRELLEEILGAEGVSFEPPVLPLVVRAGAGSVRDSLSVLDQLLAGSGPEGLTYERTVSLLGYTDDSLLDEMVEAFATGNGAAVFTAVDRVVEGGHDPRRFTTDLLDRFRDLIILAAVPGAVRSGLLDAPEDRLERMAGQAQRFGQADLTRAAGILSEGLVQMRGATSPRLLLELMCAQVLLPGVHNGEKELLTRLERLERRAQGGWRPEGSPSADGLQPPAAPADARDAPPARPTRPAPEPASSQSRAPGAARTREAGGNPGTGRSSGQGRAGQGGGAPQPPRAGPVAPRAARAPHPGPADVGTLRERWPDILDAVRNERKVAWILLNSATVHSLDGSVLTIAFPREGEARGFAASGHDQVLAGVLDAFLGRHVQIRAISGASGSAPGSAPAAVAGPAREGTAREGTAGPPGPDTPGRDRDGTAPARRGAPAGSGPADGQGSPAGPASRPRPGTGEAPARSTQSQPARPAAPAEPFADEEWPVDASGPGDDAADLSGMDLIKRQLGGQVIAEIDEA